MREKVVPVAMLDAERVRLLTRRMMLGAEEAFREFHCLYGDRLFRFLLVLTRGSEDLARELCQSTMLRVARSIQEFESEKQLWNWLTSIARNLFIDWLRKTNRSPRFVSIEGEADTRGREVDDCEKELMEALEASLNELDFAERDLVEEYYFEERTQKSIADEHFTTSKAVESKLARIRVKIRSILLRKLHHEK